MGNSVTGLSIIGTDISPGLAIPTRASEEVEELKFDLQYIFD